MYPGKGTGGRKQPWTHGKPSSSWQGAQQQEKGSSGEQRSPSSRGWLCYSLFSLQFVSGARSVCFLICTTTTTQLAVFAECCEVGSVRSMKRSGIHRQKDFHGNRSLPVLRDDRGMQGVEPRSRTSPARCLAASAALVLVQGVETMPCCSPSHIPLEVLCH